MASWECIAETQVRRGEETTLMMRVLVPKALDCGSLLPLSRVYSLL
jgi:hypothetical protein